MRFRDMEYRTDLHRDRQCPVDQPQVLLIGSVRSTDMRIATDCFRHDHVRYKNRLLHALDLDSADSALTQSDTHPDLVVLAQSRPNQFSPQRIERLRSRLPTARFIVILGSWCEGELRTGQPLPGVMRVYWHQWPLRWRSEMWRLASGRVPSWAMPATATEDEIAGLFSGDLTVNGQGLAVIASHDESRAEAVESALSAMGLATVWSSSTQTPAVSGPSLIVWDADGIGQQELAEIRQLREAFAGVPLLAMLGFPRPDEYQAVLAAGATTVVGKPYRLDDLGSAVSALLQLPLAAPMVHKKAA